MDKRTALRIVKEICSNYQAGYSDDTLAHILQERLKQPQSIRDRENPRGGCVDEATRR